LLPKQANCHLRLLGRRRASANRIEIVESAASRDVYGTITRQVPAYLDACDMIISPHVPSTDGSGLDRQVA
jgi:hypothetical protein